MEKTGKDVIKDAIQATLGSELWDLSLVDCDCGNGAWYTHVDVVVPALNAGLCHLATSNDVDEIAAAHLTTQSMALQSICDALQNISPKVSIERFEENPSQISVQYCAADKDMLCWEFSHHGRCPRRSTCKWSHAILETFLINIVLQPLMNWLQSDATVADSMAMGQNEAPAFSQTLPMGLPLTSIPSQPSGLPLTNISEPDPDDTPWPDHIKDHSFNLKVIDNDEPEVSVDLKDQTPTLGSRNPSRKSWADIQEDSDDDECLMRQWSSSSNMAAEECQ